MTRRLLAVLVAGALAAAPSALSAQVSTSLSIAGGLSLPQGDLGKDVSSGYNAAVGLNIGALLLPVGFRIEGAYNSFNAKNQPIGVTGDEQIISGTANVTLGLGLPYLIGGLGYYSAKATATSGTTTVIGTQSAMGVNIGAGVRFPLGVMTTFVEARYHKMMGDANKGAAESYVPITFGIQF
jgi:hypothetical protein